ncbi:ornithine cyclodeaminase [Hoeflea prorocentri]|uniref:Ornithine cyclodeaminase n=1 Tax=Hoeflea prorocentri TaxID=1922333 RepID=A0A9X3ZJS0_9HYPH|nr:ornithine cyclodeaminase [Hoeflea prorocentri]MCY6383100.1 ornithine cyclodeaminase [Hoeflea prorocentri]MDA5400900.1 ornithine cyclodeaminase [Hoeflea prorocentri]
MVHFVGVEAMIRLVGKTGPREFLTGLGNAIEHDFRRWERFEKTPRIASHSKDGVIELMPTSDGEQYGFKYVNGHPKNMKEGLQTVTAFGVLSDVSTGYPVLVSEMTLLTALRTAATSAMAAKHLARSGSRTMAIIGNGAQSEFQAIAFAAMTGIEAVRLYDIDRSASRKCAANLSRHGLDIAICASAQDAVAGADIVTTVTADKQCATILTDNMVGEGLHINAVGGDCPGKTELHKDILHRSKIFVEFTAQTRIEGEIQQLPQNYPVTELWQVIAGRKDGRSSPRDITLFDSVGFAIEDFSALNFVRDQALSHGIFEELDLVADLPDPRDLFGVLRHGQGPLCGPHRPVAAA